MKRLLALAALGAALAAAPGTAQTVAPAVQPEAALPMTADMFLTAAVASNGFEIESRRLALDRSQNEGVRSFAQQMIDDHTTATRELTAAAEQDGLAPVELRLDAQHQAMLGQLQAAEGPEFDTLYITLQVQAHEEAIALHGSYAEARQPGAVRDFAARTLPVLVEHHQMALGMMAN